MRTSQALKVAIAATEEDKTYGPAWLNRGAAHGGVAALLQHGCQEDHWQEHRKTCVSKQDGGAKRSE